MKPISIYGGFKTKFYSQLFSALIHWTGHEKRLGREAIIKNIPKSKGGYALEHLIGELGTTYLCGYIGIDRPQTMQSNEKYIQYWKKKLSNEPTILFTAIREAQKATDYILR